MGKRSDFLRRERDWYPTPYEAVAPLLPHLEPGATFDEPCAGDGALVDHLIKGGLNPAFISDIAPQAGGMVEYDVFKRPFCTGHMFITNPPWGWKILNPLITHLSSLAPTWLLLNADLMHNKRMGQHMKKCVKVVSVGRVSWMQNGKKGFENCAWYLFDETHMGPTEFHGRNLIDK